MEEAICVHELSECVGAVCKSLQISDDLLVVGAFNQLKVWDLYSDSFSSVSKRTHRYARARV